MSTLLWIGGGLALALLIYLFVCLLVPEKIG
jgi:K+-transporting ATPase KdpF subunit